MLRTTVTLLLLFTALPVWGQTVVWDNGPYNVALGRDISGTATADDFSFNVAQSFDRIRFWAESGEVLFGSFSGTIGWAIHSNNINKPGAILFSGSTADVTLDLTGSSVGDANIFQLEFPTGIINLPSGTYWLQLRENAIGSATDGSPINWVDRNGGIIGFGAVQDPNEVNPVVWSISTGTDSAFQLISTVPEPTTIMLMLGPAAGGVFYAWKRRQPTRRRSQ